MALQRTAAAGPVQDGRRLRVLAVVLALWAFGYAGYRAYYAAGGTFGLIGTPVSASQFQVINAVGAAIILVAAVVPLVGVRVRSLRRVMPVLGWLGAVGCCMHALVDSTLRVLSVTGVHPTQLPASTWQSFDRHAADLQDLLLNEPWFLVEGLLWAAWALCFVSPRRQRQWLGSALVACLALSVTGVLSGVGVLGSFHLG
ncbi:hypothetical protein [Amycolatopsis jiangsuensis]|uniref:DUF3995 domain-containing protein n=1 Tax=Amycolatopsis jiangsuensis TaxID=1181879 RepID=A0A840IWF6_9PSEU|nr:hypothetical protein [Amycolatopsis jiangsuensis]MBB4685765.1 hypothetical protein [Amycolatopsis jiangsuensis]